MVVREVPDVPKTIQGIAIALFFLPELDKAPLLKRPQTLAAVLGKTKL